MPDTSDKKKTALLWFREDLRIAENAALSAASRYSAVVPVFIRTTQTKMRSNGAARDWWLHKSLEGLSKSLDELGAPLILATGDPYVVLGELAKKCHAETILWNRRYGGAAAELDEELADRLTDAGLQFVIEPTIRFEGQPGEQATMFFRDPSGNALEIKAMAQPENLFAKN